MCNGFSPVNLDYDNYWDSEVRGRIKEFVLLSKAEYLKLLRKYGFESQSIQKHLFQ